MKTSVSKRASRLGASLGLGLVLLSVMAAVTTSSFAQTVSTVPVGAMSVLVTGGTPAAPVTTTFSLQLVDIPTITGAAAGKIASLTSTDLTVTGAGWTAGALSTSAAPYAVRITSGSNVGRYFGITANTADTVTVSGIDLTTLTIATGASGDTVEIVPIDTLSTLFGSTTVLGGASASAADTVTLAGSSKLAYYYNTTLSRWVRTTGPTTDRGTTAIPLNTLISITRKDVDLNLTFTGRVPSVTHTHVVANAGSTYTNTGFPTDVTLQALAIQTLVPGWVSNTSATLADTLAVTTGGTTLTYFFNGTNWQRTTGPATNRDTTNIPAGSGLTLFKRGSTSGTSVLTRSIPYTL